MFQKANQIEFMMSEVTYFFKRERERERLPLYYQDSR